MDFSFPVQRSNWSRKINAKLNPPSLFEIALINVRHLANLTVYQHHSYYPPHFYRNNIWHIERALDDFDFVQSFYLNSSFAANDVRKASIDYHKPRGEKLFTKRQLKSLNKYYKDYFDWQSDTHTPYGFGRYNAAICETLNRFAQNALVYNDY